MLWIKAFHIVAMVTWFAGLFYLPRLFVYHATASDPAGNERFKVMERKLFYGIMTPGAVVTIGLGLWLLAAGWDAFARSGWIHVKLVLVAVLVVYHAYCGVLVGRFARDENRRSHLWYRWFNEFPVLILIPVVILAVVRPF
ncbi:MAG: protoporphyrinogen oxidase HemJ [Gammaproteobacteria bacterium]